MNASETVPAGTEPDTATIPAVAYNNGTEDPRDQLNRLSDQLDALLVTMTGEGFDNFAAHSEAVQASIMWLLYGMAHQIKIVASQIDRKMVVAHG